MNDYIGLLRSINVGGRNVIRMEDLRNCFLESGFRDVQTFIQSGNVIFKASGKSPETIAKQIAESLKTRFGYADLIIIKTIPQFQQIVANFPAVFNQSGWKHNVLFLNDTLDTPEVMERFTLKPEIEQLHYTPGALFWSALASSVSKSAMVTLSSKKEYKEMTIRNVNTTRRLLEILKTNQ